MLAPNLLKHWGYRPWRAFHRGRTGSGEKGALEAGCISAQCLFNLSFLSFFTFLSFDFVDLCSFCSSWLRPFPFHIVSHARRRLTAMSGMETENTGKEARRIRRILMQLLHRREGPGERCDSVQMCLNHFKPRNQMMNYEKFSDAVTYFSFMRRPSQAQPAQFNVVSLHSRYLSMSCAINQVSWTRSERLPEYVIAGTHLSRFRYLWLPWGLQANSCICHNAQEGRGPALESILSILIDSLHFSPILRMTQTAQADYGDDDDDGQATPGVSDVKARSETMEFNTVWPLTSFNSLRLTAAHCPTLILLGGQAGPWQTEKTVWELGHRDRLKQNWSNGPVATVATVEAWKALDPVWWQHHDMVVRTDLRW